MRSPEDYATLGLGTIGVAVGVSLVLWWVGYLTVLQVVEWVTG